MNAWKELGLHGLNRLAWLTHAVQDLFGQRVFLNRFVPSSVNCLIPRLQAILHYLALYQFCFLQFGRRLSNQDVGGFGKQAAAWSDYLKTSPVAATFGAA
jgi:hypothetical protein